MMKYARSNSGIYIRRRLAPRAKQRGMFAMGPGFYASAAGGGPVDPYFAYVQSLMHFDGTNGSTTTTDVISGRVWTSTGGVLSTTAAEFGPTGLNAASGGFNSTASAAFNMGTGDYCLEGWIRAAGSSDRCFLDTRYAGAGIACYINSSGYFGVTDNTQYIGAGSTAVSTTALQYVMVARYSGTIYAYLSGALQFSVADSRSYATNTAITLGNNSNNGQNFQGYMDEFRITVGVARTTGGSTVPVPTAAFPNS